MKEPFILFHSEKCFCFCKIHFGCLQGSCFYECVQTVWKLLRKSFYDFVIFHLATVLAHNHFKGNFLSFLCQPTNKQKGDLGDFRSKAFVIPLRLVLFSPHFPTHLPAFPRIVIAWQCCQANIFRNKYFCLFVAATWFFVCGMSSRAQWDIQCKNYDPFTCISM